MSDKLRNPINRLKRPLLVTFKPRSGVSAARPGAKATISGVSISEFDGSTLYVDVTWDRTDVRSCSQMDGSYALEDFVKREKANAAHQ